MTSTNSTTKDPGQLTGSSMNASNHAEALREVLAKAVVIGGFFTEETIGNLVRLDPDRQVLVRFTCSRLLCTAEDAVHIIKHMERGGEAVRDVSLTVNDPAWVGTAWTRQAGIGK